CNGAELEVHVIRYITWRSSSPRLPPRLPPPSLLPPPNGTLAPHHIWAEGAAVAAAQSGMPSAPTPAPTDADAIIAAAAVSLPPATATDLELANGIDTEDFA
ncbi:hypothetical protein Vafri_17215, partial [Volvox africanus]